MERMRHYQKKEQSSVNKSVKNALIGFIFIFVGLIITGYRTGFISDYAYDLFISWQMLLIGIGLVQIVSNRSVFSGLILITIGGIFIAPHLFQYQLISGNLMLPAAFIIVGILFIFRNRLGFGNRRKEFSFDHQFAVNSDYVQENYIFGGGKIAVESNNFKGGKFSAVFGGGQLDLSRATLSDEGVNVLQVDLVFGGLEIIIPRDWNVKVEASSVFGSFGKKGNGISRADIDLTKVLVIKGSAVFGGAEIKRV